MTESFPETEFIWMDGKMVKWQDAQIHFLTHGLHYGSAVFEGIRCYNTPKDPAIFRLEEHTKRLFESCKIFGMKVPFTKKELVDATIKTVKVNKVKECYIRPLAFYSYGVMGLNVSKAKVQVGIACWPWGTYLGKEGLERGVRAKVSSFARHHPNAMMTKAKICGSYVNSVLSKMEAVKAGFEESIMLDTYGFVSECAAENLFIVKDGKLITPSLTNALDGITRRSVIELARNELKLEVLEQHMTRDELYTADEAFLTGTAAELTPVREIDDREVGLGKRGPITEKLQELFFNAARGKNKKYEKWLTLVK